MEWTGADVYGPVTLPFSAAPHIMQESADARLRELQFEQFDNSGFV